MLWRTVLALACLGPSSIGAQEGRWTELQSRAKALLEDRQHEEGQRVAEEAVRVAEQTFGRDHRNVSDSLHVLGSFHDRQRAGLEAVGLHQRALTIREAILGPEHLDVAESLDYLGWSHRSLAQPEKARPLHERMLDIRERALGPDDPVLADSLWTVAWYRTDFGEAEALHKRAIGIWERSLDPADPKLAARLYRLAYIYASRGRHLDAEAHYHRSLTIQETLPHRDPRVYAGTLRGIARYYLDDPSNVERMNRGLELRTRALEVLESAPDLNLIEHAAALDSLVILCVRLNRVEQVVTLLERMVAVDIERFGADHSHMVGTYRRVAGFYVEVGELERAAPLYVRAVEIADQGAVDHGSMAALLKEYSELLRAMERPAQAAELERRADAVRADQRIQELERLFGPTFDALSMLDLEELTPEHRGRIELLEPYVDVLRRADRGEQADELEARLELMRAQVELVERHASQESEVADMIALAERQLGPDHELVAEYLEQYAEILRATRRPTKARVVEARARAIRARRPKF